MGILEVGTMINCLFSFASSLYDDLLDVYLTCWQRIYVEAVETILLPLRLIPLSTQVPTGKA